MNNAFYYEKDYKLLYNQMIDRLLAKKSERIFNVQKAFILAEELHKPQFRKSGEPYILHPVVVATILEQLEFDTDVISAALLHDVVEDANFTIEQIRHEFNSNIAEIVDAVTAIEKEDYNENTDLLFDDSEFLKSSLESKTYHKLMKIGKQNKFSFYIKFDDRLHNLKTLDVMADYKQLEKVKETERWILPLCKMMNSTFFYNEISNECFKIVNKKRGEDFFNEYETFKNKHQKMKNFLQQSLFSLATAFVSKNKLKHQPHKIKLNHRQDQRVFEDISKTLQIKNISNIKASHLLKAPTTDIYLIFKNDLTDIESENIMFSFLEDSKTKQLLSLTGYLKDEVSNQNFYIVKDNNRNVYRICALSLKKYLTIKNGSTDGTAIDLIDEENSNELITDYIKVKTRSGEIMEIPENSTVLDFAFKIHNDIGFSFKYATINNSPSKQPQYVKLKNDDKINIICETDENGNLKNVSKIRWLAYVKTEPAKRALIRHFERLYEN